MPSACPALRIPTPTQGLERASTAGVAGGRDALGMNFRVLVGCQCCSGGTGGAGVNAATKRPIQTAVAQTTVAIVGSFMTPSWLHSRA
jgi:hypothetical protein